MPKTQENRRKPPSCATIVGMAVEITVTSTAAMKVEMSMVTRMMRACGTPRARVALAHGRSVMRHSSRIARVLRSVRRSISASSTQERTKVR